MIAEEMQPPHETAPRPISGPRIKDNARGALRMPDNRIDTGKEVASLKGSDRHPFGQFARFDRFSHRNINPAPILNPLNGREDRLGPFFASFFP